MGAAGAGDAVVGGVAELRGAGGALDVGAGDAGDERGHVGTGRRVVVAGEPQPASASATGRDYGGQACLEHRLYCGSSLITQHAT